MNIPSQAILQKVYGETVNSTARFQSLAQEFQRIYGWDHAEFFTSPGRTEIIGNHTDHNGGLVIAASIDMDTIGAAHPNGTSQIRITSEGYREEIVVDLAALNQIPRVQGTRALVAGMMEAAASFGFKAAGFDACVTSRVIPAAGVSSSASFEMLVCAIINALFNDNQMGLTDYARIGQYAENVFWHKASGLMDQMACAAGGAIALSFADKDCPHYQQIAFSFQEFGYRLVIVNTGKGHADLSREYSEIPMEMKEAAAAAGAERLCDTTLEAVLSRVQAIPNDRSILRAIHFFEENRRVSQAMEALEKKDGEAFLSLLQESGDSSWKLLQNCYTMKDYTEQKISLALALTQLFLQKTGGVCRIHGGGFAGVIAAIVPEAETDNYVRYISPFVGEENVYPMDIRACGAAHLA